MPYVYERHDGGESWEDDGQHGGLRDELEFERHYHQQFGVVVAQDRRRAVYVLQIEAAREAHKRASDAEVAAGRPALEPYEEPEPPDEMYASSEWVTFMSWVRMRRRGLPEVPDDYEAFVDMVSGWRFVDDEAEPEVEEELDDTGSRLDPTEREAPRTSSPRSSSSPVSAGTSSPVHP